MCECANYSMCQCANMLIKRAVQIFGVVFLWLVLPVALFSQNWISGPLKIGLVADIQFCDCPGAGAREYSKSEVKLEEAVKRINDSGVNLTVELGDMIDRDFSSFDPMIKRLNALQTRWVFIPGNHDFSVDDSLKKAVWAMVPDQRGYWSEVIGNVRLVYLNGFVNSTIAYPKETPDYQKNLALLENLIRQKAPNAYAWNGGLGNKPTGHIRN